MPTRAGVFAPINPALAAEHATELVRLARARVIVVRAAKDALSGTAVHNRVRAVLAAGTVEIVVPHSPDDEAVREVRAAYAWTRRLVGRN